MDIGDSIEYAECIQTQVKQAGKAAPERAILKRQSVKGLAGHLQILTPSE